MLLSIIKLILLEQSNKKSRLTIKGHQLNCNLTKFIQHNKTDMSSILGHFFKNNSFKKINLSKKSIFGSSVHPSKVIFSILEQYASSSIKVKLEFIKVKILRLVQDSIDNFFNLGQVFNSNISRLLSLEIKLKLIIK